MTDRMPMAGLSLGVYSPIAQNRPAVVARDGPCHATHQADPLVGKGQRRTFPSSVRIVMSTYRDPACFWPEKLM